MTFLFFEFEEVEGQPKGGRRRMGERQRDLYEKRQFLETFVDTCRVLCVCGKEGEEVREA